MPHLPSVNAALAELGAETGLEGMVLEEGGSIDLEFDGDIEVRIGYDAPSRRLVLECPLGPWPDASPGALRLLLKNNYVWTDSVVRFGIHPDSDEIVPTVTIDAERLTADKLKSSLAELVRGVDVWTRLLSEGSAEPAADAPPADAFRV